MNDDLASYRDRMTGVTVNRLSVGGGQSEDDAEHGGAENSD